MNTHSIRHFFKPGIGLIMHCFIFLMTIFLFHPSGGQDPDSDTYYNKYGIDGGRGDYRVDRPSDHPSMQVTVGMMLPNKNWKLKPLIGYPTSAGATVIALERITEEHLLDQVNWTFIWYWPECNERLAMGIAVKLIVLDKVDVIIGPPCSIAANVAGILGNYYDVPVVSWAATGSELSDRTRFPTFSRTVGSSKA